ncbi:MAG TPA: hypothetical protein VNI54_07615 [Thermoanaerobaculia bacterium]|nr:hypothetical protein [Thermoanaerobaculia bacterium]
MRLIAVAAIVLLALTVPALAQTTNPIRYTWITTACSIWNCAAAALVLANGTKDVIVLPTGNEEHPWLVLKRVEAGAVYIPEDEPYGCEVFDTVTDATSRYNAMEACHGAMIMSVPDGRAVVMSLTNCKNGKRRATR